MEPVRFYPPRVRLGLLALGCGAGGAVFLIPATSGAAALMVIGWLGVVPLGVGMLVLLARALRPGPTVLIGREGITDRTTLAATGLLRWDQITVIRKREIGRGMGAERLLEIVLSDPDGFQARPCSRVRRLLDRYRSLLKQPAVSIPGSMVSVPMQMVMNAIRQQRPDLAVLEGPPPPPPKLRLFRHPEPRRKHPDLPRW